MEHLQIIKNLGLNDTETSIYLILLQEGGLQASNVAKKIGTKRTTVYAILKSMLERGFIKSFLRKNVRFYYSEKPYILAGSFQKKLESFETLIPWLESIEKKEAKAIGIQFVETLGELKEFYGRVLAEYKDSGYYMIGNLNFLESLDPAFIQQFRKDKSRLNISTRLLLTSDSKQVNPNDPSLRREWRYINDKYPMRGTISVFDDKILLLSPELQSIGIIIAIPPLVDMFKATVEMLWGFYSFR